MPLGALSVLLPDNCNTGCAYVKLLLSHDISVRPYLVLRSDATELLSAVHAKPGAVPKPKTASLGDARLYCAESPSGKYYNTLHLMPVQSSCRCRVCSEASTGPGDKTPLFCS